MARLKWTSQALADLQNIHDFIAQDSEHYADVVVDGIFDSAEDLEDFPRLGRIVPEFGREDIREIIYGSYRIVYRLESNVLPILTVFHSSRLLTEEDLPPNAGS